MSSESSLLPVVHSTMKDAVKESTGFDIDTVSSDEEAVSDRVNTVCGTESPGDITLEEEGRVEVGD